MYIEFLVMIFLFSIIGLFDIIYAVTKETGFFFVPPPFFEAGSLDIALAFLELTL